MGFDGVFGVSFSEFAIFSQDVCVSVYGVRVQRQALWYITVGQASREINYPFLWGDGERESLEFLQMPAFHMECVAD